MSDKKQSFVFYTDFPKHMELLDDTQFREVVIALCHYTESGTMPEMSREASLIFSSIKVTLDRDAKKWAEIREKRKDAADKRWEMERSK